ncbi:NAD(P)-dependent oxidoreductase [Streptomyces sp. NPDC047028]|uniref:NAD-dependent epimerase/dehydratase family protein n=1 Tax=Streptomyces sp. NPDC047028 TaxID=3155793 RepID=UPI0033E067DF
MTLPARGAGPVVVLGGTGFAGRHCRTALEANGFPTVDVSRSTPGPHRLDLADVTPGTLAGLLHETGAAAVVNAAGAVWACGDDAMHALNARLPAVLAEAVTGRPPELRPPVVQLGTVYEYGPASENVPEQTEDTPCRPAGTYGVTKLRGTRALLDAADAARFGAVVLRVSNMLGPGAPTASLPGLVAAHLADAARDPDGPAPLHLAPLTAHRDYIDVRDVADAVLAALDHARRHPGGRVFNIGSGDTVPVRGLVRRMVERSGLPVELVEEGRAALSRGDAGQQRLSVRAAARDLGRRPRRTLDESIDDLLRQASGGALPRTPIGDRGAFEQGRAGSDVTTGAESVPNRSRR